MRRLNPNSRGTDALAPADRTRTFAEPRRPTTAPSSRARIASALVISLALAPGFALAGASAAGNQLSASRFVPERLARVLHADSAFTTAAGLAPDADVRKRARATPDCASPPRMDTKLWG